MNKDKQIEEMTKDICEYYYGGTCYQDKKPCDCKCEIVTDAKYLYFKGYRKASEVAREIFDGIEEGIKAAISALQFDNNPIHRQVKHETYSRMMCFIKHLCEKYTEEKG